MTRFAAIVDVHMVFEVDGRLLLGLRANTGWSDGLWHLPSGHLEAGESVTSAACRETAEEIGVVLTPDDLALVHVMQHDNRIGFFFRVRSWTGTIVNNEPHKCRELGWFAPDALPVETVGYAAAALGHITTKTTFSEYGDPGAD